MININDGWRLIANTFQGFSLPFEKMHKDVPFIYGLGYINWHGLGHMTGKYVFLLRVFVWRLLLLYVFMMIPIYG